jgi:hypothetical protein
LIPSKQSHLRVVFAFQRLNKGRNSRVSHLNVMNVT